MKCEVEGCAREADPGRWDMCMMHYKRWYKYRDVNMIGIAKKPSKEIWQNKYTGYIMVKQNGRLTYEHIVLAEQALGRPLPKGAQVHHMNNIPWDNHTPLNLVICPSDAYHKLLHRRMKELGYGQDN